MSHRREFVAFLERRVGSRATAEEILQDAFIRGLRGVEAKTEESIVAWFYRTLRNAAVDHHRRQRVVDRALESFAHEADEGGVGDEELRQAVCRCVSRLAETLKPDHSAALKRIEVDGLSVKDYAAEVGISASAAGVRVFRAREALRRQVARSCGVCAEHGCRDCACDQPAFGGMRGGGGTSAAG